MNAGVTLYKTPCSCTQTPYTNNKHPTPAFTHPALFPYHPLLPNSHQNPPFAAHTLFLEGGFFVFGVRSLNARFCPPPPPPLLIWFSPATHAQNRRGALRTQGARLSAQPLLPILKSHCFFFLKTQGAVGICILYLAEVYVYYYAYII